jgi:hypothetical protein
MLFRSQFLFIVFFVSPPENFIPLSTIRILTHKTPNHYHNHYHIADLLTEIYPTFPKLNILPECHTTLVFLPPTRQPNVPFGTIAKQYVSIHM